MYQQDETMLTREKLNYIRYLLLIVQCASHILRFLCKKALKKQNTTLDNLLQTVAIEQKIRAFKLSQTEMKLLYPPPSKVRDIKKWDISLLCFILSNFLKGSLKPSENNAWEKIKQYRNEVLHYPDCFMTDDTFQSKWKSLTCIINMICNDMKPVESQRLKEAIDRIEMQNDFPRDLSELRDSSLLEKVRAALEASVKDTREFIMDRSDEILKAIEDLGLRLPKDKQDVDLTVKAVVRTVADDQNTKKSADQCLQQATAATVEQKIPECGHHVAQKVRDLIQVFEKGGSNLKNYEVGSIILEFTCPSVDAMLNFVKLFYGPEMKTHLNDISQSLEALLGKKVQLETYLLRQPVLVIMQKLRDLEQCKTIEFILSCNGVEELKRIWDIFEEGGAANLFNELSVALSDAVGKPISIETSIDVQYLKRALQEANIQLVMSRYDEAEETFKQEKALRNLQQALDMLKYSFRVDRGSRNTKVREAPTVNGTKRSKIKNRISQREKTSPYSRSKKH